jgi:type II secretory pathway predicted ATPase ExeA
VVPGPGQIINDAHLMPTDCLRKLRLLCEDFPRSHNLVLIGQPPLMQALTLSINEEIRSRVTAEGLSWLKGPSKKTSAR